VIVPVLDEERVIEERLAELAALSVHEVIVADGGSRDGTRAAVARHPAARWVSAPRGRAVQMNAGAAVATGDVLVFLHADVALPKDALAHIEGALRDARVVGGAFRTWTVADRPTRLGPLLHLADLRSRYSSLPYGDQAPFVRAEVFRGLGGFPELPLMEDLAMSRLLRKAGRLRVVRARVRVSGRRFIERPVFYAALVNLYPLLYRAGVPPRLLARLYHAVR
jgi:rSAM/selenodomain-associated transferase 2